MSMCGSVCSRIEVITFGHVPTPHAGTTESLLAYPYNASLQGFCCESGLWLGPPGLAERTQAALVRATGAELHPAEASGLEGASAYMLFFPGGIGHFHAFLSHKN